MFCKTHALGQHDAEAVEERDLSRIWVGNAAQADVAVGCGGQDNVVRLNARKLFEDCARRASKA